MTNKKEQGFNDAELQDIMSEIENLEREYEGDKTETEVVEATTESTHVEETVDEDATVVDFKPKATTTTTTGQQQVEFHGAGQVNLSLNFDIAGQTAHLEISEEGLVVSLDGMHLSIDETSGCTVEMDGGVKFSVPMGGQASAKKAA